MSSTKKMNKKDNQNNNISIINTNSRFKCTSSRWSCTNSRKGFLKMNATMTQNNMEISNNINLLRTNQEIKRRIIIPMKKFLLINKNWMQSQLKYQVMIKKLLKRHQINTNIG